MDRSKLIRNEQLIRDRNRNVSQALKKYFNGKKEITETPIDFVCECSDIKCNEPIKLSITEYEKLHKRDNRFLVIKGHQLPRIETTIESRGKLDLVEKPELLA